MLQRMRVVAIVCLLTGAGLSAFGQEIPDVFRETDQIRWGVRQSEPVDAETIVWVDRFLAKLDLAGKTPDERARAIWTAVRSHFAFTPDRPKTLADFIRDPRGNCYAHSRMDLLLLRRAGLPAKYIYEVHLELKSAESEKSARARGLGLFGHYHNDHFWVLYHNGDTWVPFDTGFGIVGFDGLRKRWEGNEVLASPPFVLWEDSGDDAVGLVNVTGRIWRQMEIGPRNGMTPEAWMRFVSTWERVPLDFFMKPLDENTLARIADAARQYFGIPAEE